LKRLIIQLPFVLIGFVLGGMFWEIFARLIFRSQGLVLSLGPFNIDWGFIQISLLLNPGNLIIAILYPILVYRYENPSSKRKPPKKKHSGEYRLRG
jgi:hypothetical protein